MDRPTTPERERRDDDSSVSLVGSWLADGPGLLSITALGLIGSGLFAWFLAVTEQLLPHDLSWLLIPESELRSIAGGRVIDFMSHDRAAFGGTIVAVGILYLWLIRFPLRSGESWAWWTLALGGTVGFASFLTYLGTGYLDSWHGLATLAILPPFALGLWRTRSLLHNPRGVASVLGRGVGPGQSGRPEPSRRFSRAWWSTALVGLTGFGMFVAGITIATIGAFVVFVPQDLDFMGLDRAALTSIDARLVPLIAHDRAGFGGGLATIGVTVMIIARASRPTRARFEALTLAGASGFGAAIGVHFLIGYLDMTHVGPAILGAAVFAIGMALGFGAWSKPAEPTTT